MIEANLPQQNCPSETQRKSNDLDICCHKMMVATTYMLKSVHAFGCHKVPYGLLQIQFPSIFWEFPVNLRCDIPVGKIYIIFS